MSSRVATPRESVVFTIIVSIVVLLGAAVLVLLFAVSGAPRTTVIATFAAAIPVGPLVGCYVWLDRYEPEPKRLLAAGLLWGAFGATLIALVVEAIGAATTDLSRAGQATFIAPPAEEAAKGLFLLLVLWWRRAELDGVLDGIVYAGMVGIGFAFAENIIYLAAAYDGGQDVGPGGITGLEQLFVFRCLFSPFAHPLFTAFTGIGVGVAVGARSGAVRLLAPVAGYCCAVLAHALWNASTAYAARFIGTYLVLMLPAFLLMVLAAVWARRSERRLLESSLMDASQRGLLPATDVPWVVDLGARRHARSWARAQGGERGLSAMKDYQQAAIELGFLHSRLLRGTAPPDWNVRGQVLVQRIAQVRPWIAFPGQVVPTR